MVKVRSFAAAGNSTVEVIGQLNRAIEASGISPNFVFAFYNCSHDDGVLHDYLHRRFPKAALLGGTSCAGTMTETRLWAGDSIGLLAIEDADGNYGVAAAPKGADPAATAEQLLRAALKDADCPGELPEIVWIYQAPGHEERVIEGLRRIVGDRCAIIGGSSADNTVEGNWRQMSTRRVLEDGIVVGVLFSSGGISYSFQSGYEPTGASGIVTRSSGRKIQTIDDRPAAHVYNDWTNKLIGERTRYGGNILLDTTMHPLAVDAGTIEGVPYYLLIHPESVAADGGLNCFASIEQGRRIFAMTGDKAQLVQRAGRVAEQATAGLERGVESLAGGLLVYCGGCMLAVGNQMDEATRLVSQSFSGKPFLGTFTFGEQGRLVGRNVHGNLMISAIAFGR